MPFGQPAWRRTGLSVAAGVAAGGLVALQGLDGWPTLRTAAVVLCPVPLVLATARAGVAGALVSLGTAAVVTGATSLAPDVPAWTVVVGYGGVVAYVFLVTRHMAAVNLLLFAGIGLAAALVLLHMTVRARQHDHTLAQEYASLVQEAGAEVTANPALLELDEERRAQILKTLPIVQRLLPFIAIAEYLSSVLVSTWVCLIALRRLRLADVPRLPFGAWRLPEWFVFCFLAPAAGLLFALWRGYDALATVSGNVMAVVLCILFAHGCAILHAFLRRIQARPVMEVLVFVSVVLLAPPLPLLLMVAGLFDFLVDFRGRWTPAAPASDERPEG